MKSDNYKKYAPIIIGLLTLLIFVIGATYAYYSVSSTNSFNTTTINAQAESSGAVALTKTSSHLLLNLDNNSMIDTGSDYKLYASSSGTVLLSNTETIATTSIIDNNYYNCSYTLTVTEDSIDSLYTAFSHSASSSTNQLVLKINNNTYDLKESSRFPITYNGTFNIISSRKPGVIKATLWFLNKTGVDESYLSEKDLKLELSISNFTCSSIPKNSGIDIIAKNPNNLSENPVGGMFRFQGGRTVVNNNYICFLETNPNTCTKLRIIGITPEGQLKVITTASQGSFQYAASTNATWNNSALYSGLGTAFNNLFDQNHEWWNSIVEERAWKYGTVTPPPVTATATHNEYADLMYNAEISNSNTVTSKYSAMYVHDYLYSIDSDVLKALNSSLLNNSWINNSLEWFMTENARNAWYVSGLGDVTSGTKTSSRAARLVFYLDKDIIISTSATGTSSDPYIITGLNNNN